jgi:hypothetical protein
MFDKLQLVGVLTQGDKLKLVGQFAKERKIIRQNVALTVADVIVSPPTSQGISGFFRRRSANVSAIHTASTAGN